MDHRLAWLAAALCCATAAYAAPVTKEAYKAQQVRIEQEYDQSQAGCRKLAGHPRAVCIEQVRGRRDIQMAELAFQYQPSADSDEKVRLAKAEAAYAVTRQRCQSIDEGSAREACRTDARRVLEDAKTDARLQKEVVAQELRSTLVVRARADADEKRAEAAYNTARERCELLPGEGRENCLIDVRTKFGKL